MLFITIVTKKITINSIVFINKKTINVVKIEKLKKEQISSTSCK